MGNGALAYGPKLPRPSSTLPQRHSPSSPRFGPLLMGELSRGMLGIVASCGWRRIGSTVAARVNVCPLYRWMCTPMEKPRHVMREAGLLLTSIRPATPGYFTRSSLVPDFQLSQFGQSLITALERDHPDRALALR